MNFKIPFQKKIKIKNQDRCNAQLGRQNRSPDFPQYFSNPLSNFFIHLRTQKAIVP